MEEALELVQACGFTASETHRLVDHVFSRPADDVRTEVGDVMNTIAALASAHAIDMTEASESKLAQCWANIDRTRAKWLTKPRFDDPATGAVIAEDVELRPYLQHLTACRMSMRMGSRECTCGLSDRLAALALTTPKDS